MSMSPRLELLRTGTRVLIAATLVFLGGSTSCGGLSECQPGQSCEVRGYVVVGPEVWAFQNCGSAVLISVNVRGDEPGFEKLDAALNDALGCTEGPPGTWTCSHPTAAVFAGMTVAISSPGHYGHAGKYERELVMLQIHEASSTGPEDCAKVDPIFP